MNSMKSNIFLSFLITLFSFSTFAKSAEKEWTFLLFLNGHNNLSSFGTMNIKDMEKSGSTDQVNLVVEWGKSDSDLTDRLLVQKSTNPSKVTSPILMSLKNRDMGDYRNFVDFVKWGVDNYPAKHYFVAIWNHGSGWHFQSTRQIGINDISYDDVTGNQITTEQLGLAMSEIKQYLGRNVDIYGSDACLMQMLEVVAEMKNSVNYFVGSEELEPGEGWPYETFMKKWTSAPQSTPAEISILLSKEYLAAYDGGVYGTTDVTFSALDVSKLDAVINSSTSIFNYLKSLDASSIEKVKNALDSVQSYYYYDYKDYGDLLKTINSLPITKDSSLFVKAQADLSSLVLTVDSSKIYSKSTGVSLWVPLRASNHMERYKGLVFDQQTEWSQFLEKIID